MLHNKNASLPSIYTLAQVVCCAKDCISRLANGHCLPLLVQLYLFHCREREVSCLIWPISPACLCYDKCLSVAVKAGLSGRPLQPAQIDKARHLRSCESITVRHNRFVSCSQKRLLRFVVLFSADDDKSPRWCAISRLTNSANGSSSGNVVVCIYCSQDIRETCVEEVG